MTKLEVLQLIVALIVSGIIIIKVKQITDAVSHLLRKNAKK